MDDTRLPTGTKYIGGFEILSRYETYLTNNLYRAIHELEKLQSVRESKQ